MVFWYSVTKIMYQFLLCLIRAISVISVFLKTLKILITDQANQLTFPTFKSKRLFGWIHFELFEVQSILTCSSTFYCWLLQTFKRDASLTTPIQCLNTRNTYGGRETPRIFAMRVMFASRIMNLSLIKMDLVRIITKIFSLQFKLLEGRMLSRTLIYSA